MQNREIYQRDPNKITLLNNGVAAMTDALTQEERRTLRFELEHFVCEGEYRRGLIRILESYDSNIGQPEQPAAWISGFFGSGKSHLAKMLQYLWIDYAFPEDGATARGLARLPDDVKDLLHVLSTNGKRYVGLHAASGTLSAGVGDSVRLALLGVVFRSAGLPENYAQARFCLYLKKNDFYDQVCAEVEAAGRDFRKELNDLYVSPVIASAMLNADPSFATDVKEAKSILKAQFPKPRDISNDELVQAVQDTLGTDGQIPCTVVILDEVQQYIGDDPKRSIVVQEAVEACIKRFGGKLLFVGTGQTALSGTPALQRLQGRFVVKVELSDSDVETVIRRVVLAKKADRIGYVDKMLESHAGEIDRHLKDSKVGPRSEDKAVLAEDYPILPVRRRFWEHTLRAVDRAGTAGQLRTQLQIVYNAVRHTAASPLGTVVPGDFLFEEISANLLQTNVLLREIDEIIRRQDDGSTDGRLKKRLCSLVFLIRKLPREAAVDIGVRANPDMLADLLVEDLAKDGTRLRSQIPNLLEDLVASGVLIKLDDGYSLQTKESSEWEQEFRNREAKLANDLTRLATKRGQLLSAACQETFARVKLTHGKSKEARKLLLHFGSDAPPASNRDVPLWIRDEWGAEGKTVLADAQAAGPDSPVIHVFIPKTQADVLRKRIATQDAAQATLDFKGVPTTREGLEARDAMQTRLNEATQQLDRLVKEISDSAKVFQGGGNERLELSLPDKVQAALEASLDRLFPNFKDADDGRWAKVIQRARQGADNPLEAVDFKNKTEKHPVCAAILSHVGSGKKGKEIRTFFAASPYGWPKDAVDAALISLTASGHLAASQNSVPIKAKALDQNKIPTSDFRSETTTIGAKDRITLRSIYQAAGVNCKPNEEQTAAGLFLQALLDLARQAGGEPPLPERPSTSHLTDLQSLAGNEQLAAILEKQEELKENAAQWGKTRELAEKRLPAFRKLQDLLAHAVGQPFADPIQAQVEALIQERRLLEGSDPVPDLTSAATEGLRAALSQAEEHFTKKFDQGMSGLESADSWQKLDAAQKEKILASMRLAKITKRSVGNADEVLTSLQCISLESWGTRTAALPQRFADARKQADKLLEPQTQHVSLSSSTLRTEGDIEDWLVETRQDLLAQLQQGPIVIS